MLRRWTGRLLRTPVPFPSSLPTDPAAVPLTASDAHTLDELLHPRTARHQQSRPTHAPLRTLATAVLLPGALLVASICALLWALPAADPSPAWTRHQREVKYRNGSNVDVLERFEIRNRDRSARATFIPLGATLVDFWVQDRTGTWRDIVLGYDNTTEYLTDPHFPYFGAVVGRVANRIANASYTDPITHATVQLPANERGQTTLHGGTGGYARAGWRVVERSAERVVFALRDEGAEGFPGTVETLASYTLSSAPIRLTTSLSARVLPSPAGERNTTTPLMLSSHVYWNLDGFQAGKDGRGGRARDHRLWVDARRTVEMDTDLIPTGKLPAIERGGPLDFWSAGQEGYTIGERSDAPGAEGLCGTGCHGLDSALLFARPSRDFRSEAVARLSSASSGIQLTIRTNQPALHLFSTPSPPWGSPHPLGLARKTSHLPRGKTRPEECTAEERTYPRGGALAVECEGYVGAVHHHEGAWRAEGEAADPWYHPGRKYEWWAEYELSTFD
ncbi:hypothetical protein JCM10449v2_006022 [Rhodotorula kratochvilovae]